jgi:hypothetical protein
VCATCSPRIAPRSSSVGTTAATSPSPFPSAARRRIEGHFTPAEAACLIVGWVVGLALGVLAGIAFVVLTR